ncbi:hypothetical protein CR513_13729, partial [Mucuna pruriens]
MCMAYGRIHYGCYDARGCKQEVVENGNYIPTNKEGAKIPRTSWNEEQKIRYFLNCKAKKFLKCALIEAEYEKVHNYKSSKEISLGKTYDNYDQITNITQKGLASKAFKEKECYDDTLEEDCSYEDELSFILRKIHSMWNQKRGSRWKKNNNKHTKEAKDKNQAVCYECKKPKYFKSECPSLEKEKEKEKKKTSLKKKKKSLMET